MPTFNRRWSVRNPKPDGLMVDHSGGLHNQRVTWKKSWHQWDERTRNIGKQKVNLKIRLHSIKSGELYQDILTLLDCKARFLYVPPIHCDDPPASNSDKWRFIRIRYYKINNPAILAMTLTWTGKHPNTYIAKNLWHKQEQQSVDNIIRQTWF